jgi:uncharacterized protein YjbI with pentapeptide repeats
VKQYVILTDASDNSTYGIVVKDGMTFSAHGAHRKAEEWANWANSQEHKSLEQVLPSGIIQSTPTALRNDSPTFVKGLLDAVISGASFTPGKRSYVESHRTNAWSVTPSARDFQLRAFGLGGRQNAVSFKALAFKSDSGSYSFAAMLRSGAIGFNPKTGLVRSRIDGISSRHMQAKVDATISRGAQRVVGMNDVAHKSLIKNRDITGGLIEVKKLGQRLGSRLGGGLRAAPAGLVFIDVTGRIDADKDGIVFESTPLERPIIPRFTVPENLGRKISSLLEGSSEENEKLRRAGRLTDSDVSAVSEQIQVLLGDDSSRLSRFVPSGATASRNPLDPARARGAIMNARRAGASRVGKGGKTQINTEGSRAVEKISWDDDAKELIVTFNGGRTYTYKDVDDNWVRELESNPDFLGRILNDIKKQGFKYERGGKHAPDKTLRSRDQRRRESVSLRSSRLESTKWKGAAPTEEQILEELQGDRDLSGADMSGMRLTGLNFKNANLDSADMSDSELVSVDFTGANLYDASFTGANLRGADLREATFDFANFNKANLTDADLSGTNINGATFTEANLSGANLNRANISNTWFNRANLTGANLSETSGQGVSGASFNEADLTNANLAGAGFGRSSFTGTQFIRANLENVDFTESRISDSDFTDANLTDAKFPDDTGESYFDGANLEDAQRVPSTRSARSFTGPGATGQGASRADDLPMDVKRLLGINFEEMSDKELDDIINEGSRAGIGGNPDTRFEGAIAERNKRQGIKPFNPRDLLGQSFPRSLRSGIVPNDDINSLDADGLPTLANLLKMEADDVIDLEQVARIWLARQGKTSPSDNQVNRAVSALLFDRSIKRGRRAARTGSEPLSPEELREISKAPLYELARMIRADVLAIPLKGDQNNGGPHQSYGTFAGLTSMNDSWGKLSAASITAHVLDHLQGYNTPRGKAIKDELRKRVQDFAKQAKPQTESTRSARSVATPSLGSDNWDNWVDTILPSVTDSGEIRNLLNARNMGAGNYIRIGNDIVTPRDLKEIFGVASTRSASPYSGPVVSGVSLPTWDDLNTMRRIPGPTGLNEGYWFEDDSTGRIFFAKRGRSDGHAEAEVAGAAVYRVAGAGVPHKAIIKDKAGDTWVVSEKVDNLQNTSSPSGRVRAQAKQDMGIDMLLQVRDAWSGGNNKMVDPIGVIYTVDTGGAGPYRAQGGSKKPEFSPDAPWDDVATMIYMPGAPIRGQHISNLYGRVSNNDLVVAMRRVEHLNLQKIDQEMGDAGVPPQMRKLFVDTISARQKMAKDIADRFEGYEPSARVNVSGSDVSPGGEKVSRSESRTLIPSIFRFSQPRDTFDKDLHGPSTRSVVMSPVSRKNSTTPRFSDAVDGRVVMRGSDSSGGFDAEIVLTPNGDYVIVGRERDSDGKWNLVGFSGVEVNDSRLSMNNIDGTYSTIDDAEAAIREYVDGPEDMEYDDVLEYLTSAEPGRQLLSTRRTMADRNNGIKSSRSASLAQRDGDLRLARPADGFHYADFERMSDRQLLEEYFNILANRWSELSRSEGPSNSLEYQHVVAALRDRNMFGAIKQILDKYDMEYQASIRREVPFQIPASEFTNDGSFNFPGKRPSLASIRSARSDGEDDTNVEVSMTLSQLGDLSDDLHSIADILINLDEVEALADSDDANSIAALYDTVENAIGGVDSIIMSRDEFDAALRTVSVFNGEMEAGQLPERYRKPLGNLKQLLQSVADSDGYFVTQQMAERGHMFDIPSPGQPRFIAKFKDIVQRSKATGLLRRNNRSSYLNLEKEDRIPRLGRNRKPEPAVIDAYKESGDFEDNFSRWARLTRLNSAYAKEQGVEKGVSPSRASYESSPQFLDDVRDWDAIQVMRINAWNGMNGDDDGRGNLSLRSAAADRASTRSLRSRRGVAQNEDRVPYLGRREYPEGSVIDGFLFSEESSEYYNNWLNSVNNVPGYADEQGIDVDAGEPSFQDYASSPQFLDDVRDWDYRQIRDADKEDLPEISEEDANNLLLSTRSEKRSYESSAAFERGYNQFAMNANDTNFANEQGVSLRRMPTRNDYRYSPAFDADAQMFAGGFEPGTGYGASLQKSTRSSKLVNFNRPGSDNTTPRYSDTANGEVVSRGRSNDGNARFEILRNEDGSYSVDGQERTADGTWKNIFELDSGSEQVAGGLDRSFPSVEDAQEAIDFYMTGPDDLDEADMRMLASTRSSSVLSPSPEQLERLRKRLQRANAEIKRRRLISDELMNNPNASIRVAGREVAARRRARNAGRRIGSAGPSTRSVSERQRIANIDMGSSLRSGRDTAIDGLKSPGHRRIDEQDGQLWESLTPEQRRLTESRAIEMEESLIKAVSGAGNLFASIDENGEIQQIAMLDTTRGAKLTPIEGAGRTNEFVGLFGDIADFNLWGETAEKTVTAKNKRQAQKFASLARYQLLTTQRDPVTGEWRLALSDKGLARLSATHGKVRELLLKKRDAIEANDKLSPGLKKTQLKDINDKIKMLDDQTSALLVLAGARINSNNGRNEEGGDSLAFVAEQLPSSMRKELLGSPSSLTGAAAAKNQVFRKWATTQKGKNNKAIRYNSKEYKELKAKFDAGELPEVFEWYHDQKSGSSKYDLPDSSAFGWRMGDDRVIYDSNGNPRPNADSIVGDGPIVGDDVNLDFDHSSQLWGQSALGIADDDASAIRGDSFWRKLSLAKFIRPDAEGWVKRHNERLRKRKEGRERLERLKKGQVSYGGRAEEADKTAKELRILKRIKADRLKLLAGKKRDSAEILKAHTRKTQPTPAFVLADDGSPTLSKDSLSKFADLELLTRAPRSGELSKEDKKDEKKRQKLEKELKASNLKADRVLGSIWDLNGMQERPTVVTEEEFLELAKDSGNIVIRRGFGGHTFAERYMDDVQRHTTGDGGTMQGPGEYWAVRIEGGNTSPDGGWRGYVTEDNQRGKKGTQPGPGGLMAILPADAKIIRKSELEQIKREMNAVSGGISTALKDPSLPREWRNRKTGAAAEQLAELLEERLYASIPEGDARWQTKGGQVISQLVSAVRNASNPDERANALDALRYFVEGTNGLLQNYLAPFLGYDALRMDSGVMLVMNRGKLITYGGVGGLGMTDAVEEAIKTGGRLDPALVKKLNNGERVD